MSKLARSLMVMFCSAVLLVCLPGTAAAQEVPTPEEQPAIGQGFDFSWDEPSGDPAARGFTSGGCAGNFSDITKVNNRLEWGVENHCAGNGWIPHQISLVLQEQQGLFFFEDLFWRYSASALRGSPNISMYFHSEYECEFGTSTDYRMEATITAGSHTKTFLSDEFKVPCKF